MSRRGATPVPHTLPPDYPCEILLSAGRQVPPGDQADLGMRAHSQDLVLTGSGIERHFIIPSRSNNQWEALEDESKDMLVRMRVSQCCKTFRVSFYWSEAPRAQPMACGMYAQWPSPCRKVEIGDEKCNRARRKHGLPALALNDALA